MREASNQRRCLSFGRASAIARACARTHARVFFSQVYTPGSGRRFSRDANDGSVATRSLLARRLRTIKQNETKQKQRKWTPRGLRRSRKNRGFAAHKPGIDGTPWPSITNALGGEVCSWKRRAGWPQAVYAHITVCRFCFSQRRKREAFFTGASTSIAVRLCWQWWGVGECVA